MKQLKKLAFVMAFVMMVTLCAGALAEEDSVELTLHMIDPAVNQEAGQSAYLKHGECLEWGHWGGKRECDCFLCPCGEEWRHDDFSAARQDRRVEDFDITTTVTVKKGHMYTLDVYNGNDHVPHGSDYQYVQQYKIDYYSGDSVAIYDEVAGNNINLNADGKNELTLAFDPLYIPTSFTFEGTVTMNGEDPGSQTFDFYVWELTEEQKDEIFDIDSLFTPENFPELPAEGWTDPDWEPESEEQALWLEDFMENTVPRRLARLVRQRALAYPATATISSSGSKLRYTTREFTFYDLTEGVIGSKYTNVHYVIAGVNAPSESICYDDAIYAFSLFVRGFNPQTPVSLDVEEKFVVSRRPLEYYLQNFIGFSSERGYVEAPYEHNLKDIMVFLNRTCPFYNPPAAPEAPAAPAVPQTGDNSPILVWLALACISGMALLTLNRKKA